jgi:hypothetical protein
MLDQAHNETLPHAAGSAGSHATLPRDRTCAVPPGGTCAARNGVWLLPPDKSAELGGEVEAAWGAFDAD